MDNNYQNNPQQPNQTNGMAIAALVCGIIGVVGCFFGWFAIASLVLSIVGIVLGAKGMQVAKTTGTGNGLAIAGLVCGRFRWLAQFASSRALLLLRSGWSPERPLLLIHRLKQRLF